MVAIDDRPCPSALGVVPRRRVLGIAMVTVALVVTAACSGGGDADDTLQPLPGVTPQATTVTAPPRSGSVVSAPGAPTTPSSSTTSSGPGASGPIALRPDGLGAVVFGDDPAATIATMTEILGAEPSVDSGWTDPTSIGGCPGSEARAVSWGDLTLYFSDSSDVTSGRRHFFTYYYGTSDQRRAAPPDLATPESLTVGATVSELRASYDDVATFPPGDSYPATFITSTDLFGVVTGEADTDRVNVIAGGMGCGR